MILVQLINGWPACVVSEKHAGDAPDGHKAFEDRVALVAWMSQNADKAPKQQPSRDDVPPVVPAWKAVLVLKTRGHYDALDAFIRAMTGPNAAPIQARWEFAEAFPRSGKAVDQLLNAALGYTEAQTDELFREAAAIPG